jgi:hypothetical protein
MVQPAAQIRRRTGAGGIVSQNGLHKAAVPHMQKRAFLGRLDFATAPSSMFERICREIGITQRQTRPASASD